MSIRASRGFTLMETLVMLVLVSFAVMLMFQMLGNYRIAKERTGEQAGHVDRRALTESWFRESIEGLYPLDVMPLQGTPDAFTALSLSPVHSVPGSPVLIGWAVEQVPGGSASIIYSEGGEERWRLGLRGEGTPAFIFIGDDGRAHDRWPPDQGLQQALPAAIALSWGTDPAESGRLLLASVRNDREPRLTVPFEVETD